MSALRTGEEPILPRVERELVARVVAAEPDLAKAAKLLGLTEAALQKRVSPQA